MIASALKCSTHNVNEPNNRKTVHNTSNNSSLNDHRNRNTNNCNNDDLCQ